MPPLRDRGEDIVLLFRLFAMQMSEKYHLPRIELTDNAKEVLKKYKWPGNVRQLKNITEQMSVLCKERKIDVDDLLKFIPMNEESTQLATIPSASNSNRTYENEREMLFKILYEMRSNVSDLRHEINSLRKQIDDAQTSMPIQTYPTASYPSGSTYREGVSYGNTPMTQFETIAQEITEPENLNLSDLSRVVLEKALERNGGNRNKAAQDLGISTRTLYRRLKEFGIK